MKKLHDSWMWAVPFFFFFLIAAAAAADNEEPITDEFCITSTKKNF